MLCCKELRSTLVLAFIELGSYSRAFTVVASSNTARLSLLFFMQDFDLMEKLATEGDTIWKLVNRGKYPNKHTLLGGRGEFRQIEQDLNCEP